MTIEQNEAGFEVICNQCDYVEIFNGYDFSELIARIKQLGWRIYMSSSEDWEHLCPDCERGNNEK